MADPVFRTELVKTWEWLSLRLAVRFITSVIVLVTLSFSRRIFFFAFFVIKKISNCYAYHIWRIFYFLLRICFFLFLEEDRIFYLYTFDSIRRSNEMFFKSPNSLSICKINPIRKASWIRISNLIMLIAITE